MNPFDPASAVVRVFVAGARGSIITDAALVALGGDDRVQIVGVELERTDSADLEAAAPDVLISAAHERVIPNDHLAIPRLGAVGLHPSKLPRNRGSYPLWWALKRGYPDTALTLFHLIEKVDAGLIIDQRTVDILPDDTFATLYARVAAEVHQTLASLVEAIVLTGRIPAGQPQDPSGVIVVTTPPWLLRLRMRVFWAARRAWRHRTAWYRQRRDHS